MVKVTVKFRSSYAGVHYYDVMTSELQRSELQHSEKGFYFSNISLSVEVKREAIRQLLKIKRQEFVAIRKRFGSSDPRIVKEFFRGARCETKPFLAFLMETKAA